MKPTHQKREPMVCHSTCHQDQATNHARVSTLATYYDPATREKKTQEVHAHAEWGEKNTPKINVHLHPSSRKKRQGTSSFLALPRRNQFQTPPQRMALNNNLSRSLRWVELSSCKEPLISANSTHRKPFRSESLEKT